MHAFPPHPEPLEARIAPATFVVTSLADGAPVADGQLTLREALAAATTNQPSGDAPRGDFLHDTITFAPALAGGTIQLSGSILLDGGGRLSIVGPGTTDESIMIRGDGTQRVLEINSTTDAVILSHLGITGGVASAGGGGAILNNTTLFLDDVLISGNTSTAGGGGGIANIGSTAKLSVNHSRFLNNVADVAGGGAILNSGTGAQLTLHDAIISGNTSSEGAGLRNAAGASATITVSRITGNHGFGSGDGAGLRNEGTMQIDGTTISGNVGEGSAFFGGGLRNDGTLTISNSTISDNLSQGRGGGIRHVTGALTIFNSTISGNTALGSAGGGGIKSDSGTLTIVNSTIAGNIDAASSTGNGGGGISHVGGGALILQNTIVAGNFATGGEPADIRGAVTTGNNNFIGIGTAALTGIATGSNGNQIGTAGTPLNAKLGPLQDNGGATFTMLPLPGSPVIDAGDDTLAARPSGLQLLSDQRGAGFARSIDGDLNGTAVVDIGAAEFFLHRPRTT